MESQNQALRNYYRVAGPHLDADVTALHGKTDRDDVAFYVDIARRAGGPVLEFGAGTGRVGLELVRAGIPYTGVDLVQSSIEIFADKLGDDVDPARVKLKEGDVRTMQLDRRFACVVAPGRVFEHLLTDDDRRRALNRVKAHLVPGGLFVLDAEMPSFDLLASAKEGKATKPETELERPGKGKGKVRRTSSVVVDRANQLLRIHHEWLDVGARGAAKSTGEGDLTLRWSYRFELELLLRGAGFEILELYGGFDRRPFDGVSGSIVVIARPLPVARRTMRRRSSRPSSEAGPRRSGPRGQGFRGDGFRGEGSRQGGYSRAGGGSRPGGGFRSGGGFGRPQSGRPGGYGRPGGGYGRGDDSRGGFRDGGRDAPRPRTYGDDDGYRAGGDDRSGGDRFGGDRFGDPRSGDGRSRESGAPEFPRPAAPRPRPPMSGGGFGPKDDEPGT